MYSHDRRIRLLRRRARLAVGSPFLVALLGCLTVEQMAPRVESVLVTANTSNESLAALEEGRNIYITDCARCHSVERVNRYTVAQWEKIVERMAPESKLDAAEKDALRSYLMAAHKYMSRLPSNP